MEKAIRVSILVHSSTRSRRILDRLTERLVHGPLTALMLLETMAYNFPPARPVYFEYRARNPLVVGKACTINGAWHDKRTALLWCVNEDGVVGMTGSVVVEEQ